MGASQKGLNLIFENCTGRGSDLPNGIDLSDERLLALLARWNWSWHGEFLHEYRKKFGHDVPVFCNYIPISENFFYQRMLYEFTAPHRNINKNDIYFFPIGAFGNIDTCLGMNENRTSSISLLSDKTIELINNNSNVFLLINHMEEGYFTKQNIMKLVSECRNKNITSGKVVFGTACYNAEEVIEQYLNEIGTSYAIKTVYYNWALESCSKHWRQILNRPNDYKFYYDISHYESITTEEAVLSKKDEIRENRFLSFNNKLRSHRMYFLSILNNINQLNNNLISYDVTDLDKTQSKSSCKGELENWVFTEEEVNYYLTSHDLKTEKQTVDIENIRDARGHGWDRESSYINSYINLTTETLFFEDCHYISEKIFKPIANLQPFVVIGSPFILKELKKLGFKTFDSYWDETYDSETSNVDRFRKLNNLIIDLSNKPIKEIHDMYYKMLPDLVYNQKLLLSYEDTKTNQIELVENLKSFMPSGIRLS